MLNELIHVTCLDPGFPEQCSISQSVIIIIIVIIIRRSNYKCMLTFSSLTSNKPQAMILVTDYLAPLPL